MAELPQKADSRDVELEKRWALTSLWDVEKQRLDKWIKDEAADRLASVHGDADAAKKAVNAVVENIRLGFVSDEANRDPRLVIAASSGQIEKEAGSRNLVLGVRLFLLLSMICEIGFFVVLFFLHLGNMFLVLQGILLAAGSFMVGSGVFEVLRLKEDDFSEKKGIRRRSLWGILLTFGGIAIIGFVLWLRVGDGEDVGAILAFTLALALAITILTCYHKYLGSKYEAGRRRMLLAQRWIASDQHKKACDGGYWREEFLIAVDQMARKSREVFDKIGTDFSVGPTLGEGIQ
jgi:uncharacterized membrane protein